MLPLHIIWVFLHFSISSVCPSSVASQNLSYVDLRFDGLCSPEPAASPGPHLCDLLGRPCLQPPRLRGRKSPTRAQFGSRIVSFFPQLFHIHATCDRSLKLRNQPPSSPSKSLPVFRPSATDLSFQRAIRRLEQCNSQSKNNEERSRVRTSCDVLIFKFNSDRFFSLVFFGLSS